MKHFQSPFEGANPAQRGIDDILSSQSLLSRCVWVCVGAFGLIEGGPLKRRGQSDSSDEVTCWSLFKHCPEPLTSSLKHANQWAAHNCWHTSKLASQNHYWWYQWFDTMFSVTLQASVMTAVGPGPCRAGPPLWIWLRSQPPHLFRVNSTLGTINTKLAEMLLTLLSLFPHHASRMLQM